MLLLLLHPAVLFLAAGAPGPAEAAQVVSARLGASAAFSHARKLALVIVGIFNLLGAVAEIPEHADAVFDALVVDAGLLDRLLDQVQHAVHDTVTLTQLTSTVVTSGADISKRRRKCARSEHVRRWRNSYAYLRIPEAFLKTVDQTVSVPGPFGSHPE